MDIITRLEGYGIKRINKKLDKIFATSDIDKRMNLCDDILEELRNNEIEVDDIMEDEIKELTLR